MRLFSQESTLTLSYLIMGLILLVQSRTNTYLRWEKAGSLLSFEITSHSSGPVHRGVIAEMREIVQ